MCLYPWLKTWNSKLKTHYSRLITTKCPCDGGGEDGRSNRHGADGREGPVLGETGLLGQVVARGLVEEDKLCAEVTNSIGATGLLVTVDVGVEATSAEILDALLGPLAQ